MPCCEGVATTDGRRINKRRIREQRDSMASLSKLYIEPTNCCNLTCRTCIRNIWGEEPGYMSQATFDSVLAFLRFKLKPWERLAQLRAGGNGGGPDSSADRGLANRLSAARAARASAESETLTAFF